MILVFRFFILMILFNSLFAYNYKQIIKDNKSLVLIDLRAKKEYDFYHIKKSRLINRKVLKNMTFLKDKKIVLISHFWEYCKLVKIKNNLIKKGFLNVNILENGIEEWYRNNNIPHSKKISVNAYLSILSCSKINIDKYSDIKIKNFLKLDDIMKSKKKIKLALIALFNKNRLKKVKSLNYYYFTDFHLLNVKKKKIEQKGEQCY